MSAPDSIFPEKEFSTINPSPQHLISLNDVFRECITKAQATVDSLHIIVRCEDLPKVRGNYNEVSKLFNLLLKMIFSHPPPNSKLFLYVVCTAQHTEVQDPLLQNGYKRYLIKLQTNIDTSRGWQMANDHAIAICKNILSEELNGNLVVNSVSSTACLFSISLPGKFE